MCGCSAASGMIVIPNNQLGAYSVTPNTKVNFLVRATADNPPPASAQYALAMAVPGTATSIDNLKVWNNERLSKLLLLASYEPPTTSTSVQAHKLLNFKGWLKDASGNPAPFANVSIAIKTLGSDIEYSTLQADEKGMINGSVSLSDTCVANDDRKRIHNRVYSGTPTNPSMWWDIDFSIGNFAISVGDNNYGSFYHICKERLVETCFYDKNYSTGMTELKCF